MSMGKMDPERVIKVSTSSVNAVITMARDGAVSVYGCKRVERVKEGGHLKLAFRSSTIETRKDSSARWWWSRRKKKTELYFPFADDFFSFFLLFFATHGQPLQAHRVPRPG